jgi:sulfur relay (sulfurtransferase) DsrF/TusC family protein
MCLVLDRGPYGSIEPAEAVRHAGGALGKGWEVVLALAGDAVYAAQPGQMTTNGEWVSLSTALAELIDHAGPRGHVLVETGSLDARDLSPDALVPGVRAVSCAEIARAMVTCDRTLLF